MKKTAEPGLTWGMLRELAAFWKRMDVRGLTWAKIEGYVPRGRDPAAGYDWKTLMSKEQTWELFRGLGLSWAAFEILRPRERDPDAGYTWLDIAAVAYLWQALRELGYTWAALEALAPAGHWTDHVTVEAVDGKTFLLQLSALDIKTSPVPKLRLTYDPEALSWSGRFLRESAGLPAGGLELPAEVEFSEGSLTFKYPKQAEGSWSGLVAGVPFTAKRTGTAEIHLD